MTVVFDGTRVSTADTITDGGVWDKWGASQNPSAEPDFFYQGAGSISNKVGTAPGGVEMDASTGTHDFSSPNRIWLAKVNAANYAALNVRGVDGMILYIGSANTDHQYEYYVHGKDTYPIAGGWVFIPIDPNIAGYRDATQGTPDLNNINYWGVSCDFTSTSKSENVMMDALDYFETGKGLTLDGTGQDFDDFIVFDEGTSGNRYGIVRTIEGVVFVIGVLTIGTATQTVFVDTARTLVFVDGLCGEGWCGIDYDLQATSTSIIIISGTFIGRGSESGPTDTRPDYSVSGTTGTFSDKGSSYRNFRRWSMTSACNFVDTIFDGGNLISHTSGCLMANCLFQNGTQSANVAYIQSPDLEDFASCTWSFSGGHGIEITVPGTYAFDDNFFFDGFGATGSSTAMVFNNSGGLVTINISGGTTITYRNGSGASTVINNTVAITIFVRDEDGNNLANVQSAIFLASDDTELMNVDTGGTGRAATTFNFTSNQDIYWRIRKSSTGDPKRLPQSGTGTITSAGFTVTLTMVLDPNVDV